MMERQGRDGVARGSVSGEVSDHGAGCRYALCGPGTRGDGGSAPPNYSPPRIALASSAPSTPCTRSATGFHHPPRRPRSSACAALSPAPSPNRVRRKSPPAVWRSWHTKPAASPSPARRPTPLSSPATRPPGGQSAGGAGGDRGDIRVDHGALSRRSARPDEYGNLVIEDRKGDERAFKDRHPGAGRDPLLRCSCA